MTQFTVDWFDYNTSHLSTILLEYSNRPNVQMLEIGAYEGRSTVWFLEHVITGSGSTLTSVDTWLGSIENDPGEMGSVWDRFQTNTRPYSDTGLDVVVNSSQQYLAAQVAISPDDKRPKFDIIYVDGSHAAPDVLSDAVLAWALLAQGGVLIFDDYWWSGMYTEQERPRFAIDSFLACFLGQYDEMHRGYQVVVRKRQPSKGMSDEKRDVV